MSPTSGDLASFRGQSPSRERVPHSRRGVWCELQAVGRRPVLVLSRDVAIPRLGRAFVAPCTTTIRGLASEVLLEPGDDPVPLRSAVNLDSVESVSVASSSSAWAVSDGKMRQVCSRSRSRRLRSEAVPTHAHAESRRPIVGVM